MELRDDGLLDGTDQTEDPKPEVAASQDFGDMLRQARERRGVSLRHIAVTTKISVTALEALERNNVSRLPGGIFSRGFVRSYATEVGLDPEHTVQEFIERYPTQDAGHSTRHTREFQEAEDVENQRQVAGTAIKLVGISLPLVALILYFTLGGFSTDPAADAAPPSPAEAEETPARGAASGGAGAGESGSASDAGGGTVSAGTAPAGESGQRVPVAGTEDPAAIPDVLRIAISATGACWVSVVTDGRQSFARVLDVGDEVVEEVHDEIVMQIGDAGSFAYTINNVPGRALGTPGQVVTARIGLANYETYLER